MKNYKVPIIALATACVGLYGQSAQVSSQATRLEPKIAKPGMVLTITGVALGKTRIEEVFLTDHRFDLKVTVLEQSDNTLKIRVPPFIKAGRHQLLLLMAGPNGAYLEQPVFVLVEVEDDVITTSSTLPPPRAEKAGNNTEKQAQ